MQEVEKGIAFLDEKGPANWRDLVRVEALNISSSLNCVLGQIYGNYVIGVEKLELDQLDDRVNLGFTSYTGERDAELTLAWKEALA